jgi:hypothetical protein
VSGRAYIVQFMCGWLLVVLAAVIVPTVGHAELADFGPPPASAPFDDVDEATLQAEVIQQVLDFLDRLHRHWGEGPERVRTLVEPIARQDENTLITLRNLQEHGVVEGYEFRKGSLACGQYVVLQRPLNGLNEFIGYYTSLKQALIAAYGEPGLDRVVWDNDLYQPVPDYWGVAVMIGHLRYHATWETADGTITLELSGNRHSRLSLEYRSRHEEAQT